MPLSYCHFASLQPSQSELDDVLLVIWIDPRSESRRFPSVSFIPRFREVLGSNVGRVVGPKEMMIFRYHVGILVLCR